MTSFFTGRISYTFGSAIRVKAVVSGIYITEIKSVRGGAIPAPPKKKGFFARFKKDKSAKNTTAEKTESKGKKNK